MGDMKIGEGKKFDASQVSAEGLTKEEINEITKKNKRLIKIFQAYDTDGKSGLSSSELAAAMDDFIKAAGEDGKISKKEFQKMADEFNKWNEFSGGKEVSGEDLKKFMKSIKKATKRDEKVSTQQVLDAERQKTEAWIKQIEQAKAQEEMEARAQAEAREKADKIKQEFEAQQAAKAQQEAEAARIKDLQTPKKYTVQNGESFTDLIKRSLAAQGIENPTDAQMKEAIAEFKKNNPGAVHKTQSGLEYLYAGAEVKIAGNLEDKANAKEVESEYRQMQDAARAEEERLAAEDKEKQEKGLPPYAARDLEHEMPEEFKPKFFAPPQQDWTKPLNWSDASNVDSSNSASVQKNEDKPDPKKIENMNKYPLMEELPNGYSRRDVPGFNDAYFDKNGNRISKETYLKERGPKSRAIDNMVSAPIIEQLPNGYTKRDIPGWNDAYYKKDGTPISKEEFEAARNEGTSSPVQKNESVKKTVDVSAAENAGMKFDVDGNSTTHEGYKIMSDGTVQKALGENEFINYEFYPNGKFKTIRYTKGDWKTTIKYQNNDTNRWLSSRNLSSEFTKKYDFNTDKPRFL